MNKPFFTFIALNCSNVYSFLWIIGYTDLLSSSPLESVPSWSLISSSLSSSSSSAYLKLWPFSPLLREGSKKTHWICDHDHTLPDNPPLFLKLWSPLGFFFCNVFWLIGWFRYVLKHILGMFETNFGFKKIHWICYHDHTLPE